MQGENLKLTDSKCTLSSLPVTLAFHLTEDRRVFHLCYSIY